MITRRKILNRIFDLLDQEYEVRIGMVVEKIAPKKISATFYKYLLKRVVAFSDIEALRISEKATDTLNGSIESTENVSWTPIFSLNWIKSAN